jgi:hypothetical protein
MHACSLVMTATVLGLGCGGRSAIPEGRDGASNPPRHDGTVVVREARLPSRRGHCVGSCSSSAQCQALGLKACVSGSCRQCQADADCDSSYYKGGCTTASGTCRMCKADADCATTPFKSGCDTSAGVCRMCKSDADCNLGMKILTGKCDASTGQCWRCTTDADCDIAASSFRRCGPVGRCVQCLTDSDCPAPNSSTSELCDQATATCSGCLDDADCKYPLSLAWKCVD